jgi:hypothetical protein
MRAVLLTIVVVAALAGACGRSSPDPCRAREGLSCEELASERALEQGEFDAAVASSDGNAIDAEGACVQAFVSEQLERFCVEDRCTELCGLHPCAVNASDGTVTRDADACVTRCREVTVAVDETAVDAALVRAASRPGLCTCAICDDASAALCTDLFACVTPE